MKIISILFILSFTLCSKFGSWTKDSLYQFDYRIDKARTTTEKAFFEKTQFKEEDYLIKPFALYNQLVNGLNYKILFSAQNIKTDEYDIYDYVIYTGPFGESLQDFDYQVISTKKLNFEKILPLTNTKYENINKVVAKYYSSTSNNLLYIDSIKVNESTSYMMNVYIVTAQTEKYEELQTLIVMEQEDHSFEVVSEIKNYNNNN